MPPRLCDRSTLRRKIKKTARLWIRLSAVVPVTRKPLGIRMGKGKGVIDFYATPVRPGQIIFEMDRVPRKVALQALTVGAGGGRAGEKRRSGPPWDCGLQWAVPVLGRMDGIGCEAGDGQVGCASCKCAASVQKHLDVSRRRRSGLVASFFVPS